MDCLELITRRRAALRRALLNWYERCARDLPWRRTKDPYRIWVSEIMLQQTQVATAQPFYTRFLGSYPTVELLAAAPIEAVLKCWEGLGYYRRARNLHAAAGVVVNELGGELPRTARQWRTLPGVGRYTAAAIASIAFDEPEAVLDGNVKRVLARLAALDEPIDHAAVERALWSAAAALVGRRRCGDLNQAMMELGARVCTPRRPRCDDCPVRRWCEARAAGTAETLPRRTPRRAVPHHEVVAAAIARRGRWLLGRRGDQAMLGGLWEFPGGKVEPGESHEQALRREIEEETGLQVEVGELLARVEHAYTHFSITLSLYACRAAAGRAQPRWHAELRWLRPEQFDDLPLPTATRKLLKACRLE